MASSTRRILRAKTRLPAFEYGVPGRARARYGLQGWPPATHAKNTQESPISRSPCSNLYQRRLSTPRPRGLRLRTRTRARLTYSFSYSCPCTSSTPCSVPLAVPPAFIAKKKTIIVPLGLRKRRGFLLAPHPQGGHTMRETGMEGCGMLRGASAQRSGFLWCYEPVC